jgi:DNA-binding NarL/FixJ family response regulator
MQVTVSLVESNHALRGTFTALLRQAPGLLCVGAYRTAEEALQRIPLEPPDVALVDLELPGLGGAECAARLKVRLPTLQILMLTMYRQDGLIFDCLCAGATGYMSKSAPAADLIHAIQQAQAGGAPMSMAIARKVMDYFQERRRSGNSRGSLTPRERKILELLAKGSQDIEAGEILGMSQITVRTNLRSIYAKLHAEASAHPTNKVP